MPAVVWPDRSSSPEEPPRRRLFYCRMKCPKCKAAVTSAPDAAGLIICAKCGARLRSRAGAEKAAAPEAVARTGSETVAVSAGTLRAGSQTLPAMPLPGPAVRSRRRKTVLLIDDDPSSRIAALQALEHAEVPTRTAPDGSAGLAAIAQEKPDVIVLELGIDGAMSGKDVVNMVKATMEWVDVPIVLYTRVPIESQKEARIIHGADELVPKGVGGPEALVARIIGLFRKG